MKNVSPFVAVDHCKEALERYRAVLGGEIRILMEQNGRVLQAELHLGDFMIHFADTAMAKPAAKGDHVKVMVEFESEETLRKAYEGLIADGQIPVPLHQANFGVVLANVTGGREMFLAGGWIDTLIGVVAGAAIGMGFGLISHAVLVLKKRRSFEGR
jgi:PhnB protein